MVEFGDGLEITYVMGGLAREFEDDLASLVIQWLDAAAASGMPVDPRVWHHDGVRSTYPACIAFRAAAEQERTPRAAICASCARASCATVASSTAPRRS